MSDQEQASASTEKVLFYHSKPKKDIFGIITREPRVTVCAVVTEFGNGAAALDFGFARCSPHDQFSKVKGRQLSEFRAKEKPTLSVLFPKKFTLSNFTELAQLLAFTMVLGTPMGISFVEGERKNYGTSMKDSEGTPIYEGDIIKLDTKVKKKYTDEEIAKLRKDAQDIRNGQFLAAEAEGIV